MKPPKQPPSTIVADLLRACNEVLEMCDAASPDDFPLAQVIELLETAVAKATEP